MFCLPQILPLAARDLAAALALLLTTSACSPAKKAETTQAESERQQQAPQTPSLDTPMQRDLDRICNAEEQSGALDLQPEARAMHTGVWLANALESREARELSARLSPLPSEERARELKRVLAEHSIAKCEILHAWGHP